MDRADLIWIGIPLVVLAAWAFIFRRERTLPWWGVDVLAAAAAVGGGFLIYEARRQDGEGRVELETVFNGVFDSWLEAVLLGVITAAALVVIVMLIQRVILRWQRMGAIAVGALASTMVVRLFEDGLPNL